jgi:thioredoxin-like negative regulator of GroEL
LLLALCGFLTFALLSQRPVRNFFRRLAEEPTHELVLPPTRSPDEHGGPDQLPDPVLQAMREVEARPQDPDAHLRLAEEMQAAGMTERAVGEYVEAAMLWMSQDDPLAASKSFAMAMALSPPGLETRDAPVAEAATQAFFLASPMEEFGSVLETLAESRPGWPLVELFAIRHEIGVGDPEIGLAALEDYLQRYPDDPYAKTTLAELNHHLGDSEAAARLVDELLESRLPRWLRAYLFELKRDL